MNDRSLNQATFAEGDASLSGGLAWFFFFFFFFFSRGSRTVAEKEQGTQLVVSIFFAGAVSVRVSHGFMG